MQQERNPADAGRNLLERLQPFPGHCRFEMREAGDIAAGPRQTCDQANFDRSRDHHEHDRHRARLTLHSRRDRRSVGQNRVRCQADQLRGVGPQAVGIGGGPPSVDPEIAALDPPQFSKCLPKRREANL